MKTLTFALIAAALAAVPAPAAAQHPASATGYCDGAAYTHTVSLPNTTVNVSAVFFGASGAVRLTHGRDTAFLTFSLPIVPSVAIASAQVTLSNTRGVSVRVRCSGSPGAEYIVGVTSGSEALIGPPRRYAQPF